MSPFFCLWNPESPRAVSFTASVWDRLGEAPQMLSWAELLQGAPPPRLAPGVCVRIDSPGKNWEVEKALLLRGAARAAQERAGVCLTTQEAQDLVEDPGLIIASRQHHLGFLECLDALQKHVQTSSSTWMQHPEDIAIMCDKAACQAQLAAAGVNVPPALGIVSGFDDLMARMEAAGMRRVFLKLCHGSSASGTVALERAGVRMQAFSTARMQECTLGEGVELRNWRNISRYTDLRDIRRLVDAVCRHRAHAEAWLPKAGWRGRRFDVRVVVIGGRARQVVARLAEGPFTNLQFGARRASAAELRDHLTTGVFEGMCAEAERAMASFPRSLYGGVDVLVEAGNHRPRVLEINAFGDLLPGVLHEGRTTYDWEVNLMLTGC